MLNGAESATLLSFAEVIIKLSCVDFARERELFSESEKHLLVSVTMKDLTIGVLVGVCFYFVALTTK